MKQPPGHKQPLPARPLIADVDRQFRRVGTGEQVRHPNQIQQLLPAHPLPPLHHLIIHHGDVGGGAAKGNTPQAKEHRRQCFQALLLLGWTEG